MNDKPLAGSPFAGRLRRRDRNRAVLAASVVALTVAAVLMVLVVRFASQRPDEVNLGGRVFAVADAERLARRIEQEGTPFLFKDPLTRRPGREVYVHHVGPDSKEGWLAIEAYAPGSPRRLECILVWDQAGSRFRDPCGGQTFPADGSGLRTYPAEVDEGGRVVVDLRS